MKSKEHHIVESMTAIVRESDPDLVRRWDNDRVQMETDRKVQTRTVSVQLAVSVLNADPNLYNRIKNWSADKDAAITEVEKPHDFYGESVKPMADMIYEYITQDK